MVRAAPAAMFYYSRDRAGEHPQAHLANYAGIFQADAYGGYNKLYEPDRKPGSILEAACWVHARRPFFVMADLAENARRKALSKRYNEGGPEALGDRRVRNGTKPTILTPEALAALRERITRPPDDGGLWTGPTIARWLAEFHGLTSVHAQRGWDALSTTAEGAEATGEEANQTSRLTPPAHVSIR